MSKREWYQQHTQYRNAIRLARMLIREKLVVGWEPDALTSWLVRPLARMLRPRKAKRKAVKRGR